MTDTGASGNLEPNIITYGILKEGSQWHEGHWSFWQFGAKHHHLRYFEKESQLHEGHRSFWQFGAKRYHLQCFEKESQWHEGHWSFWQFGAKHPNIITDGILREESQWHEGLELLAILSQTSSLTVFCQGVPMA